MKVAMYYNNSDIRIEEMQIPEINDGEILVKVKASGICGTDLMEWYRIKKAPRVFGHEIAGEIVESKSKKYKAGQRVFVSHHVPCFECKYCLDGNHTACDTLHSGNYDPGGYSEYVRVPKINVDQGIYILGDNVTYEEGTMIEPLACVVRGQKVIGVKKNHTVLVLGSGVSGLLNVMYAKMIGAKVIATDINEYRLNKAKEFGADEVYRAEELQGIKADRVIVCAGADSVIEQAFRFVDKKGVILLFAISQKDIVIPTVQFWRNEIAIVSSYGAASDDLEESLTLISQGKINVKDTITHRLSLEEIQRAYEVASLAEESLKVVLIPQMG